jgi:hypothetical protein
VDRFLERPEANRWASVQEYFCPSESTLNDEEFDAVLMEFGRRNPTLAVRLHLFNLQETFAIGEKPVAFPLFFEAPFWASAFEDPRSLVWPGRGVMTVVPSEIEILESPYSGLVGLPFFKTRAWSPNPVAPPSEAIPWPAGYQKRLYGGAGSILLGALKRALAETSQYMGQRIQGGRVIKEWSASQDTFRRLSLRAETGERLLESAQNLRDVLGAHIFICEEAPKIISCCMDLTGGMGYMREFPLAGLYSDVITLISVWGRVDEKKTALWNLR